MKVREHGTASMYAAGCRCRKCTAANSASSWAKRKAQGWDAPVDMAAFYTASDPVRVVIRGEAFMVPPEAIRRAVGRFENAIKVEALAASRSESERKEKA